MDILNNFEELFALIDNKIKSIPISNLKDIRSNLAAILVPRYIYFKGESDKYENKKSIRFILNSKNNTNNNLYNFINGTIFQIYTNNNITRTKLLCIGFEKYNKKIYNDIHTLISNNTYVLYKIIDGFKINIYYSQCHSRWIFSTEGAFDIGDLTWRGYKYLDVIYDTLSEYPNFNIDKLNKTCSYSFIFKHPAYNIFNQPTIWKEEYFTKPNEYKFDKSVTLLGYNKIIKNDFIKQKNNSIGGIELQKKYNINDIIKIQNKDNINYFI